MKEKIIKNKKTLIEVLVLFVVALVVFIPMFTKPYKMCVDTEFHVSNIIGFEDQIKDDFLSPSKVIDKVGNGFGYGTRLFYPPLPHSSVAYLDLAVNNIEISMKIIYFISIFASGLTMYFLSKKMSKNSTVGLISGIIYMLFPYHLSDMYIRDAFSETFIFVFLPLILSGIYELFYNDSKKFYLLFVLGYVGGILTHTTMMMYFTFLIFIFLAFNFKKLFTKKVFLRLCVASILILLISSSFWITLVEHKFLGDYAVFKDGIMVQGTQGNGLFLSKYFNYDVSGVHDVRYFLDFMALILMGITIFLYRKIEKSKFYLYLIILGCVSLFMSTVIFPWDLLPKSLRMIQFPWRMVTFVALFFSLIAPLCFIKFKGKFNNKIAGFVIIFMVFSFFGYFESRPDWDLENGINYERGLGYQYEYLPMKLYDKRNYLNERNHDIIIDETAQSIKPITDEVPYLKFSVEQKATIELPRIYYIGYVLKNESGKKISIYENENGFIGAELEKGTYILDYEGTNLDKICKYISLISLVGFVFFVGGKYGKD